MNILIDCDFFARSRTNTYRRCLPNLLPPVAFTRSRRLRNERSKLRTAVLEPKRSSRSMSSISARHSRRHFPSCMIVSALAATLQAICRSQRSRKSQKLSLHMLSRICAHASGHAMKESRAERHWSGPSFEDRQGSRTWKTTLQCSRTCSARFEVVWTLWTPLEKQRTIYYVPPFTCHESQMKDAYIKNSLCMFCRNVILTSFEHLPS